MIFFATFTDYIYIKIYYLFLFMKNYFFILLDYKWIC